MADRHSQRPGPASPVRAVPAVVLVAVMLAWACATSDPAGLQSEAREPVEAHVAVDRAVATTGDVITFTVELDYLEGYEVELPEPGAQISGFRIQDVGSDATRRSEGRIRERRWYRLRADLVGSYILPPIQVLVRSPEGEESTLTTSEIFVEVETVLPEDGAATDIRDVKPLRRPQRALPWVWIVAGSVVFLSGLALAWWWRGRRRLAAAAPGLPAHEVAFLELDKLRRTDFGDLEELRAYYFSISEVLRTYIESRFGLNATDLTTEEILGRLDWLRQLADQDAQRLREFLNATDQVKFAAQVPDSSEIETTYEAALGFVESTRALDDAETERSDMAASQEADSETQTTEPALESTSVGDSNGDTTQELDEPERVAGGLG